MWSLPASLTKGKDNLWGIGYKMTKFEESRMSRRNERDREMSDRSEDDEVKVSASIMMEVETFCKYGK